MFFQNIDHRQLLWKAVLILLLAISPGMLGAQNIISNPGFEVGKVGELPEEWDEQKEGGAEGKVVITDEGAYSGKQCLLIEHTNDIGYIHPNKSIDIKPGDYTFSFWARSDKETQFEAQIYRTTDWGTPLNESCNLKGDKWTKFEFAFSTLEDIPGSIQIGLTDPGRLWLDDVELVKKSDTEKIESLQTWDTMTPFADQVDIKNRADWSAVPTGGVFILPKGDLVVENGYLAVAFCSKMGKAIVYSKSGEKRAELTPLQPEGKTAGIKPCRLLSNTDKGVVVEANFAYEGVEDGYSIIFSFSKWQIFAVRPEEDVKGIHLSSPIDFAIVPSFIGDDLIFQPEDYASNDTIYVPSENALLGLLDGENSMLFITWPKGDQTVSLTLGNGDTRLFTSVDFENDRNSLYVSILDAPGIWHKENLQPDYLEKPVAINWERPFPAKWVTQLYEDDVKTRYTFKESESKEGGFWRAGVGWHTYPVWFEGENAFYHLSKKIPPKGQSIIYFLERKGTPTSVYTPVDIMRHTLDDQTFKSIIDSEGRKNRSLTRPDCAVGTATCEVTDKLMVIFEAGEEVEKRDYVKGGAEDMVYFLTRERERAEEYQAFAREMLEFLALTSKEKPELKDYLDRIKSITEEIIEAYEHEKENIKDLEYARQLADETIALAQQKNQNNYIAFMTLKWKWTGMGGAIDDLNRKLHTTTRKLFQEAGYGAAFQKVELWKSSIKFGQAFSKLEAIKTAEEIRRRTIKCLRNPGHYEIWSDY